MANFWGKAIHVNNCKPDGLEKDDTPVRWTDGDMTDVSTTGQLVWEQSGSPLRTIWLPEGHSFYDKPAYGDLTERCLALIQRMATGGTLDVFAWMDEAKAIITAMNPTDPDLIEARDCVAKVYEDAGIGDLAQSARDGKQDDCIPIKFALAAFRRGRDFGK